MDLFGMICEDITDNFAVGYSLRCDLSIRGHEGYLERNIGSTNNSYF